MEDRDTARPYIYQPTTRRCSRRESNLNLEIKSPLGLSLGSSYRQETVIDTKPGAG
jgi:hypothetical protein